MSRQQQDEILLSDAARLAGRAAVADVPVMLDVTSGVPRVFQSFGAVLDEAGAALDRASAFLKAQFALRSVPASTTVQTSKGRPT